MKYALGFLAIVLVAVGCSSLKPACILQKQGIKIVSNSIVSTLHCSNASAVQSSVQASFQKLGICAPPQGAEGPLADAVCPAVSQWVAGFVSENVVPSEWGCDNTAIKSAAAVAIEKACKLIPLSEKDKI